MVKIIADTTCGLPYDMLKERGIPVIPQVVMFGEESFHDDRDFDTTKFLEKLKASKELPKTAAPEPPLYYPLFEEAKKNGESVVVVAPTSKASGTGYAAEGGLMSLTGPGGGDPYRLGVAIADISAGMFAVQGITLALLARPHVFSELHY